MCPFYVPNGHAMHSIFFLLCVPPNLSTLLSNHVYFQVIEDIIYLKEIIYNQI